jgi:hypothetical protein
VDHGAGQKRVPGGSRAMETLADTPRQEERKLNLCLTGFEAKEGETKNELVQRFNIELLHGQMELRAKVVAAIRQWPIATWTSALAMGTHPRAMLFKFTTNENR